MRANFIVWIPDDRIFACSKTTLTHHVVKVSYKHLDDYVVKVEDTLRKMYDSKNSNL